jgi:hypothetical protein
MATFVLVPGVWLGAWVWEDTVRALRERGHTALRLALPCDSLFRGKITAATTLIQGPPRMEPT